MVDIVRRRLLQGTALVGGLAATRSLFPAPAVAQIPKSTGEIVVYDGGGSWGEAKRIAYFEPFERETGIKVIAQPRTDTGAARASVLAGAPRYDVMILPGGKAPTSSETTCYFPLITVILTKPTLIHLIQSRSASSRCRQSSIRCLSHTTPPNSRLARQLLGRTYGTSKNLRDGVL